MPLQWMSDEQLRVVRSMFDNFATRLDRQMKGRLATMSLPSPDQFIAAKDANESGGYRETHPSVIRPLDEVLILYYSRVIGRSDMFANYIEVRASPLCWSRISFLFPKSVTIILNGELRRFEKDEWYCFKLRSEKENVFAFSLGEEGYAGIFAICS